jgi:DNA-binding XRE family transcriptional regulator
MTHINDDCDAEADKNGVPYGVRLMQLRGKSKMSTEAMALELGWKPWQVEELEMHPQDLTRAESLSTLFRISRALSVPMYLIFDDGPVEGPGISESELRDKIEAAWRLSGLDIDQFEDQVGYTIHITLGNPSEIYE